MHPLDLKDLILEGESSKIEFKRKFTTPEKIAKEIAAFANTIGGYLLIGVEDDGKIVGIDSEKADIDSIEYACGFYLDPPIEPDIEIVNINNKDVVVVHVAESKHKPHKVIAHPEEKKPEKQAYIRVGEQSLIASSEMTRVLFALNEDNPPLRISIGDKEKRLFAYLEQHKKATVKDFTKLVNISRRRAERLLVRLVRAGVLQIHQDASSDYFTLVG